MTQNAAPQVSAPQTAQPAQATQAAQANASHTLQTSRASASCTAHTPKAKAPKTSRTAHTPKAKAPKGGISSFAAFRVLLRKDLRREFRTKEMLTSMGIYAVLVLIVYGAALAQAGTQLDILQMSGGLMWALIVFTSLLGLNRSFAYEKENACLEGLMLIPMDRGAIFLAKAVSNFVFLLVVEIITVPLFAFFFLGGYGIPASFALILVPLALGSVGMAAVGTLLATITANTKGKDVMLAVLFIPLIFPLLYACVTATTCVILGSPDLMDTFLPSIAIAAAYDIIMTLVSWVLYDFAVSA